MKIDSSADNLEVRGSPPTRDAMADRVERARRTLLGTMAMKTYVALADQSLVSGSRFVTTLFIGRLCGADALGTYSLAFTIYILVLCSQQSLIATPYTIISNRLRGQPRAEFAGSSLVHSMLLSALAMVVLAALGLFFSFGFGPVGLSPLMWTLMGAVPFALLQDFGRRHALAHLRVGVALVLDSIVAVVQIGGLTVLAVTNTLSPGAAYAVLAVGCGVSGLAWLVTGRNDIELQRDAVAPAMKRNWNFGKWVYGSLTTSVLNGYIMYWLVALVLGNAATGIYAACMTLLLFSNPFLMGLSNVLTPKAAQTFNELGRAHLRRVVIKMTIYQGIVMTAFCAVVALFGGTLVALLFDGPEYAGHGLTIAVLSVGFLAGALSLGAIDGLLALERPDINFKTSLLGLLTKLALAAVLIQTWGILGTAIGSLVGSTLMSVARWIIFLRMVRPDPPAGVTVATEMTLPVEAST